MLALSLVVGWLVWRRPIPPTWSLESDMSFNIAGITSDGRLVTTERASAEGTIPKLCIRDVRSGKLLRSFNLDEPSFIKQSLVSPDGSFAVVVNQVSTMKVVSLESGQLRFPTGYAYSIDEISPDSRYALIERNKEEVIDLENGETISTFEGDADFSEDSQRILITQWTDGVIDVWIRDLKTGSDAHLGKVPKFPDPKLDMIVRRIHFHYWRNDRLYVSYQLKADDELGVMYQQWSYNTRGSNLTDPRLEPHLFTRHEAHRVTLCSTSKDGHRGELRLHFPPPEGSFIDRLLDGFDWLGFPTGPIDTEYSWQPIDDMTEKPMGLRVEGLTSHFLISPDGQWLVDLHPKSGLRGWALPARRSIYHWLQSGAATLVPILLFYLGRWIRRTPAVRVPSTN